MPTQQFLLSIDPGSATSCQFELRESDTERQFHLSLHFDTGRCLVSDMHAGAWGEGVWHDLPAKFDMTQPLLLHREDARVFVFIGADCIAFSMNSANLPERPLPAAVAGMSWRYLGPDRAAGIETVEGAGPVARLVCVRIARHQVLLPPAIPPAMALEIAVSAVRDLPDYLRFLAALGPAADAPVRASGYPALVLAHALLFPRAPVTLRSDAATAMTALAQDNAIGNLTALSPVQWQSLPPGAALIIGEDDGAPDAVHRYLPGQPPRLPMPAPAPPATPARQPDTSGLDIVVALYNTRTHIRQCVESLLCEGRADIRVIVVDDGSTDDSGDLVRTAFAGDARVRVVAKANGGCASARNYGRLVSGAAHIAFVDADDGVDPGFFAGLYDLATATGGAMVQGGFDFLDDTRAPPRWPYGGDLELADLPLESVAGMQAQRVPSARLLRDQPAIWRKVYRRDFLDRHAIWFPESIRAYDDYLFHLLTLTCLPESWMLPGRKYLYRQHPGQDIRAGDARHFNMLAMFSMLARRAMAEGWSDFAPYAQTMLDAVHWSSERLSPGLVSAFLQAAAQVCAGVARGWGPQVMGPAQIATVAHPDFRAFFDAELARTQALPGGAWWAQTTASLPHPDSVRMALALSRSL